MKPIKFKEMNSEFGKKQLKYLDLPAYRDKDGVVTTCWEMTLTEKIILFFTGKLWLQQIAFGEPLQPQKPCAKNPLSV